MSFVTDFDPDGGDLIYGRGEVRHAYLTLLPLSPAQRGAVSRGAWFLLDNYNNAFGTSGKAFTSADKPSVKSVHGYIDGVEGLLQPDAATPKGARQASYYNLLRRRDSRFAPATVFDLRRGELSKEGWAFPAQKSKWYNKALIPQATRKSEADAYLNNRAYKALRRVCKLGIAMVATEQSFAGAKILFVLDGLDMGMIARKEALPREGTSAAPITSSELRYVFRHWQRLQGSVRFYVNGNQVDAPWDTDWDLPNIADTSSSPRWGSRTRAEKAEWDAYAGRRITKYGGVPPDKGLI